MAQFMVDIYDIKKSVLQVCVKTTQNIYEGENRIMSKVFVKNIFWLSWKIKSILFVKQIENIKKEFVCC